MMHRRKLKLKAEVESSTSHFSFKGLVSMRFQLGSRRGNLHHLAMKGTWRSNPVAKIMVSKVPAEPSANPTTGPVTRAGLMLATSSDATHLNVHT